jgi:hypothetical protein
MTTYAYRRTHVDAFDLTSLEGENTISIPRWVLNLITNGDLKDSRGDWAVKKPDGSIGFYSNVDFHQEFEAVPSPVDR